VYGLWQYFYVPRNAATAASMPPIPVHAKKAVAGTFPVYFSSLGTVTALNTVTVRSRVDGELVSLHFREGEHVKAGALLALIDPRPFQAQLDQAQGQLMRDEALLRNARENLARAEALHAIHSIAPKEVDANRALVNQYEGAVKMDKGQVDAARLQLEFTRISAPISGKTGLRAVDAGNMIHVNDTAGMLVITQTRPINVLFTVTESQLPAVLRVAQSGTPLQVEAWDRTKQNLLAVGKLVSIDNQVNTSTGTIRLKAEFTNEDDQLYPNLFVNAKIRVTALENACIVPTAAIQLGTQGSFVYVVGDNSRVSVRQVATGPADDDRTVITAGVAVGERLVIDGLDQLREKRLVSVIDDDEKKAEGSGAAQSAPPVPARPPATDTPAPPAAPADPPPNSAGAPLPAKPPRSSDTPGNKGRTDKKP
jgi:multidrug efflux system membrane fusion protein